MAFVAWDENESMIFGQFSEFEKFFSIDEEPVEDDSPNGREQCAECFTHDESEFGG